MLSDNIIIIFHSILLYTIAISPFINDLHLKKMILIFLIFLCLQFLSNYGKCGIINIERFFLKENFKKGFCYRLIKPVISHKHNIFYKEYFGIVLIYILILWIQLDQAGMDLNIINDYKRIYYDIRKKFEI